LTVVPVGNPAAAAARILFAPLVELNFGDPGGYTSRNVVCLSRETYIGLWVEKYELVSEPGTVAAALSIAFLIATLFVASPSVWKTTTLGGRTPTPNAFSARWLAS
jgi:hypothetical protein